MCAGLCSLSSFSFFISDVVNPNEYKPHKQKLSGVFNTFESRKSEVAFRGFRRPYAWRFGVSFHVVTSAGFWLLSTKAKLLTPVAPLRPLLPRPPVPCLPLQRCSCPRSRPAGSQRPSFSIRGVSSVSVSCLSAPLPFILWPSWFFRTFVPVCNVNYLPFYPPFPVLWALWGRRATCLTCHVFRVPGTWCMFSTYLTHEWVKAWNVLWLRLRPFLCTLKLHIYSCGTSYGMNRTLSAHFVLKGGPGTLPMSGGGGVDSPWIV